MDRSPALLIVLSALAMAASARSALAQVVPPERSPLGVAYLGTADCPSAEDFAARVAERAGPGAIAPSTPADALLHVEVRATGSRGWARLELREPEQPPTVREVQAADCDQVVSAIALVTAMVIDGRSRGELATAATAAADEPARPPSEPTEPAAAAFPDPPASSAASPEAAPPASPPTEDEPVSTLAPPPAEHRWRWEISAHAVLSWAIAPVIAPGAELGGGIGDTQAGWRLRASAAYHASMTVDTNPGSASFEWRGARAVGCGLSWRPSRQLSLSPCLLGELGRQIGTGTQDRVQEEGVWWAALGALGRLAVEWDAVGVELLGGVVAPLVRERFVFERAAPLGPREIYQAPMAAGHVTGGLYYRF